LNFSVIFYRKEEEPKALKDGYDKSLFAISFRVSRERLQPQRKVKRIEEDDEDMTKPLEYDADWKGDQLVLSLNGLFHKGLLNSYNWTEQASKCEINAADALLIIATMLARQNDVKL
jgi:hypothetical protein